MENTHRFFANKQCKYYPCHATSSLEVFNCLFCFCPLYHLGENCGGKYGYGGEKRKKTCVGCAFPHMPANYDEIMKRLKES
jgi:Zn-finger protein